MNESKCKTKIIMKTVFAVFFIVLLTGCPQKIPEEPKPVYYTVIFENEGGNITVSPAVQGGTVLKDSVITVLAQPDKPESHEIDTWDVTGGIRLSGGEDGSIRVKVTADTKIRVTFKEKPKYSVRIEETSNGSVTSESSISEPVYKGTVISFTGKPEEGYKVEKWEITGGTLIEGCTVGDTTVKIKVTEDMTVKAYFIADLKLKSLTVFDQDAVSGSIRVRDKHQITPSFVKAVFNYGTQTDQSIPVTVITSELQAGENTVSLEVKGKPGIYADWTYTIKVLNDMPYRVSNVEFNMISIAAVTDEPWGNDGKLSLSSYLIGETEVTQGLWKAVMGDNPSFFDNTGKKELGLIPYITAPAAGEIQENRPVESISFYKAIAFCNELTKKVFGEHECVYYKYRDYSESVYTVEDVENKCTPIQKMNKKGFRLPTRAEWKWAARGGTDDYIGINNEDNVKEYGWYQPNSIKRTHEVKKKKPNPYGLYDMLGNVFEFCWDFQPGVPDPTGSDPTGPVLEYYYECIVRGGSWDVPRLGVYGWNFGLDGGGNFMGFRLVCRP